ncbi:hypothetical protein [Bacillus mycoides]|uniref:hypothetical protein n=1 Tax=Bacillus mycoides TaxID=1405 RepID=UPI003D035BE8
MMGMKYRNREIKKGIDIQKYQALIKTGFNYLINVRISILPENEDEHLTQTLEDFAINQDLPLQKTFISRIAVNICYIMESDYYIGSFPFVSVEICCFILAVISKKELVVIPTSSFCFSN